MSKTGFGNVTDGAAIERRLLELAYTTDAKITAPALAYFAPCSIADASRVLDDLAAHERLRMEIEDDGTVVYQVLGRQRLADRPLLPAVEPIQHRQFGNPLVAALLALVMPGAGHIYAGRVFAGLGWFVLVTVAYGLILPGLILHLISVRSAARAALDAGPRSRLQLDRPRDFAHTA